MVSVIGWGWEELIELLRRTNRLSEFGVLWHCPKVSFDVSWDDPELFARQFAIWTTTYALAPGERLPIQGHEQFRIERYRRPDRLLSLHSRVVTEEGCRFFLMLDLLAPHDLLGRVMTYLGALLRTGGVRGGGFVIRTSRSFHFIGRECVDAALYRKVLDLVLKSGGGNGIVDVGYCAHTLARELETGLRLQPAMPEERLEVVAELPEMPSEPIARRDGSH
ncbi:MAG: hypothetical protein HY814_14385 [Candidatus Riflebacteria bacterium]|nr:hypothetical protein [Candidatus Riflebacteria bacterium]